MLGGMPFFFLFIVCIDILPECLCERVSEPLELELHRQLGAVMLLLDS